jgi:hypothetical protein
MELLAGPYLKHCDNDGMLDLVGLKQLMDNMGHPENDEALLYLLHEWDVENRGYANCVKRVETEQMLFNLLCDWLYV